MSQAFELHIGGAAVWRLACMLRACCGAITLEYNCCAPLLDLHTGWDDVLRLACSMHACMLRA